VLEHAGIAIRGRDEPEIRASRDAFAETLVFAIAIEHTKEVRLQLDGQLADLVEEEAATIGLADEATPLRHAGVRIILRVAKKLRVDEAGRKCGRIARDELLEATRREMMNGTRRELFAGAALAEEQRVRVGLCRERELLAKAPNAGRLANDAVGVGLAERTDAGLWEKAERRDLLGTAGTVEKELATEVDDIARAYERSIRDASVHLESALAEALDVRAVLAGVDEELSS
jgi:hypothetical protein